VPSGLFDAGTGGHGNVTGAVNLILVDLVSQVQDVVPESSELFLYHQAVSVSSSTLPFEHPASRRGRPAAQLLVLSSGFVYTVSPHSRPTPGNRRLLPNSTPGGQW
jgi:hypothetical protein